jgi:ubiquinone/menaquinone biosynthesis C-methylase UbiE
MTKALKHERGTPMPYTRASHLLNPVRGLLLSPGCLVSRLGLKPDFTVLELGPGPGYFSPAIARALPTGKLVLVDCQREMLDMAKSRLDGKGIENVEYRLGDAIALPAETGSFDVVFMVSVLGEVSDCKACLREIHRALRPNGLLSVTEYGIGDPHVIPVRELQSLGEAEGFELQERHRRLFHYTLGFRKVT